ncbi:MAG: hypothetical protein MUC91_13760 [Verrucomicrobia bacterium]|nr:hypothetical protein [Verrucomicrobiota bacterium]
MSSSPRPAGRRFVWFLVFALFVAHQDFWFWDNKTLVLGFMPVGLFYHAAFSLAAGLVWAAAIKWAWPAEIEAWADAGEPEEPAAGGKR